jgi:peptide/nickel transport system ATP-binding protein
MPLLQINNLVTEFRTEGETIKAVNDVSLTLEKGTTLGIVGESGSGKSVTALSIMQLIPDPPGRITGGEIIFNLQGKSPVNLLDLPKKELRSIRGNHISMIFQEPMTSLNPVYPCGKQIMESLSLHQKISKKAAKNRVMHLFNEVQLTRPGDIFNSYPHQLSGGQKQRVMIAMAISSDPSILIADEPTTALDVTVQKAILELMNQLQEKYGMAIIFISHDLGVIAEIADQTAVMYKGKIVESGDIKTLFKNPQHPYTQGLLACRPTIGKRLKKLPTIEEYINRKEHPGKALAGELEITPEQRRKDHLLLYSRPPILEIKNLCTYFQSNHGFFEKEKEPVKAVDQVSFDVYPGETLGLVGESGCGKTTLGRSILRLTEPTSGKIWYKGVLINHLSQTELRTMRKHLQIIFQDPYSSLNPRMTVGNAIMEPMKVHHLYNNDKIRKQKTLELLQQVQLEKKHFYRYPHEFSGGQRQRICIARALSVNPEFIICDESVSALDVSIQAQILNLLNELKEEFNFTYIFISHDLSVVKFMSDRIVVMKDGKIQEVGDADEVYSNPKTEYTKNLIAAIPAKY